MERNNQLTYDAARVQLTDGRKCWHPFDKEFRRKSVLHPATFHRLRRTNIAPCKATAEDLDRVAGVNLRGTFLCYKYAGLQMIAQGRGGRIIGKVARSVVSFL
jgi:NAD(P)-dependent dehydrogenase (short-subunit alcohol dehydrogenase family)